MLAGKVLSNVIGNRRNTMADIRLDIGFFVKRLVTTMRRYAVAKEKISMIIRPAIITKGPCGRKNNGKNSTWNTGRK